MKRRQQYQMKSDVNEWRESLEFFRQENSLLKYRLSETVDNSEGNNILPMAEYFQNEFLILDDNLKDLFNRLDEFADLINHPSEEKTLSLKVEIGYIEYKQAVMHFEKKFLNLTKDFNLKMLQSFQH